MIRLLATASAAALLLHATGASAALPAAFTPIDAQSVSAISGDGTVVTGKHNGRPYLWSADAGLELIDLPTNHSLLSVADVSGDGTTVVGGVRSDTSQFTPPLQQGFKWTRSGGFQFLGNFSTEWFDQSYATAVSHDGSVVVGSNDTANGFRAFRWTAATGQINLGHLGTTNQFYPPSSDANDISADGEVVVGQASTLADDFGKAYRWTPSGGFDVIGALPVPPAGGGIPNGNANAVSGDGKVIGGYSQVNHFSAWTWTSERGFKVLDLRPGATNAGVTSLSYDGSTVVGVEQTWSATTIINRAAVWRKVGDDYEIHLVADLLQSAGVDVSNWKLTHVVDVSYDGRTIVGTGYRPNGAESVWIAVLPVAIPEPASAVIALAMLSIVSAARHR